MIKKINILLSIFSMTLIGINSDQNIKKKKIEIADKIVFENCQNVNTALEVDTADDNATLNSSYTLTVRLNYDEITVNSFSNKLEKNQEFNRLREYYTSQNEEKIKDIDLSNFDRVYVSSYSPFLSIDATYDQIKNNDCLNKLAGYDQVSKIYVNENKQYKPLISSSKRGIYVNDYVEDGTYTGEDAVIGVLECGIVDKSHENLKDSNIEVRDEWYYFETVTKHATVVSSILTGKYGIAKKSKLLSVEIAGNAISEVDWMLARNVDIINCSYGDKNPSGYYSSDSAYMDFIVNKYQVIVVAAAGNEGEGTGNVGNPALGYNVISVGASDHNGGGLGKYSSYKENSGPRCPTLVAPGYNMIIHPFTDSFYGTSFAAPIVTACLALLFKEMPLLTTFVPSCIALLSAGANNRQLRNSGNGYSDRMGAGFLDFEEMIDCVEDFNTITFKTNETEKYYTFHGYEGDHIRFATAWLAYADGNVSNTKFSDYDITIYDDTGSVLSAESTSQDNRELIETDLLYTGYYKVLIKRKQSKATTDEKVAYCLRFN